MQPVNSINIRLKQTLNVQITPNQITKFVPPDCSGPGGETVKSQESCDLVLAYSRGVVGRSVPPVAR